MKPIVGIICDTQMVRGHLFHQAGGDYIKALQTVSDAIPLLIPSTQESIEIESLLDRIDGFLLPGSYSNVQRHHYGEPAAPEGENEDILRDSTSLPLIQALVEAEKPFLAICRGCQEVNVALGGTLYPRLQEVDGRFNHRESFDDTIDQQYALAHSVTLSDDGLLNRLIGENEIMVNSLHEQGIHDVANGLSVEAIADDDTIEAVSAYGRDKFGLAVQWHPEWNASAHKPYTDIFKGFADALKAA